MPIWLRNITFKFIQDSIKQENDAQNKAYSGNKGNTNTTLDWANPDKSKFK